MDTTEQPDSGFSTRQGRGQWHLVVLVLLIGVTSIVLAWQAPWWLVPGYWAMLAWLLGGADLGSRSVLTRMADRNANAPEMSSYGVGVLGDSSTEDPASEDAPKAKRARTKRAPRKTATSQARKSKLLAEPLAAATWVQIAPGKFVRVEVASEAPGPCLSVEPSEAGEALPDAAGPIVISNPDEDVACAEDDKEDDRVEPETVLRPVEPHRACIELDANTIHVPSGDVYDETDTTSEPSSQAWEPTHEEMACQGPHASVEQGATEAAWSSTPRSCVGPLDAGPRAAGIEEPRGLPPRGQRPARGGDWIPRSENGRCRSPRMHVRRRRPSPPRLDRTRRFTWRAIRARSRRSRSPPSRSGRLRGV